MTPPASAWRNCDVTHDITLDASAQAVQRSLQQWVRSQIAQGHPARLVFDVIEGEAAMIRLTREGQDCDKAEAEK